MSNKMMRKELLAAGLVKKPVQGGLNMQQQDGTKTEEQILTEVNARLGSVQERAEGDGEVRPRPGLCAG